MKFNKARCKALHLDQGNSKYKYRLGRKWIGSDPEEDDLKVLLTRSPVQPRKKNCGHQVRGGGSSFSSALVRLHMVRLPPGVLYTAQEKMDQLEQVQRKATEMITDMEHFFYEDMLRDLRLLSLENRRVQRNFRAAF